MEGGDAGGRAATHGLDRILAATRALAGVTARGWRAYLAFSQAAISPLIRGRLTLRSFRVAIVLS